MEIAVGQAFIIVIILRLGEHYEVSVFSLGEVVFGPFFSNDFAVARNLLCTAWYKCMHEVVWRMACIGHTL